VPSPCGGWYAERVRKRARGLIAAVAWATAILGGGSGCHGDDDEADRQLAWCSALCDLERACYSLGSCEDYCLSGNEVYLDRMRAGHLDREMACFSVSSGCDIDAILEACYRNAQQASVPTLESARFCLAMAQPFFECGWYSSPETCAQSFGSFADGALAPVATHCSSASCYELERCVSQWLWN
jgi:hypothetical protein